METEPKINLWPGQHLIISALSVSHQGDIHRVWGLSLQTSIYFDSMEKSCQPACGNIKFQESPSLPHCHVSSQCTLLLNYRVLSRH